MGNCAGSNYEKKIPNRPLQPNINRLKEGSPIKSRLSENHQIVSRGRDSSTFGLRQNIIDNVIRQSLNEFEYSEQNKVRNKSKEKIHKKSESIQKIKQKQQIKSNIKVTNQKIYQPLFKQNLQLDENNINYTVNKQQKNEKKQLFQKINILQSINQSPKLVHSKYQSEKQNDKNTMNDNYLIANMRMKQNEYYDQKCYLPIKADKKLTIIDEIINQSIVTPDYVKQMRQQIGEDILCDQLDNWDQPFQIQHLQCPALYQYLSVLQ